MDEINRPDHYNSGKIEVIDFITDHGFDFCTGNVVKYISRAGLKTPDKIKDLKKAAWYLNKKIELTYEEEGVSGSIPVVNIYPLSQLEKYKDQKMNMFLAHLVKYPAYRQMIMDSSGYAILDNSVVETGEPMDVHQLIQLAISLGVSEIILPDCIRDKDKTHILVNQALSSIEAIWGSCHNAPFKIMAVPQGANEREWVECLNIFMNDDRIDVIGVPKWLAKEHPQGRPHFEQYWQSCEKPIHLLGLYYSFEELTRYAHPEKIRSVDSCLGAYFESVGLPETAVRADGFTLDLEDIK